MRYGDRWALRQVSLAVEAGEVVAVIGANGAGKTTLLSILAGIHKPSDGSVEVFANGVGWIPQQLGVYRRLTIAENLRFFARIEGVEDVDGTVGRMLSEIGLDDRARDPVGELSGGNQQRVNVAAGLVANPELIIMDEPTSALDVRQRQRLWRLLRHWVDAGAAIVYATHNVAESEEFADRVLVLADGEAVYSGTAEELDAELFNFLRERGH